MAYLPGDVEEFDIAQFKGSAQASDPYALDNVHGLYSQNIDFIVGPGGNVQCQSRRGTSIVTTEVLSAGWVRQAPITVPTAEVAGDLSDFPVALTSSAFPAEMLTLSGPNSAQSDGGDIRFYSDAGGLNRLSCEITVWNQNVNPSLSTAVIWVLFPGLSSIAPTTIYVRYAYVGGGQSQPAVSAPYGAQSVWSSGYLSVWHFGAPSSLSGVDSSPNVNLGTFTGSPGAGTGPFEDSALVLNGSSQYMSGSSSAIYSPTVFTVSAWVNPSSLPATAGVFVIVGKRDDPGATAGWAFELYNASGTQNISVVIGGMGLANFPYTLPLGTWTFLTAVVNGTSITLYVNGSSRGTQVVGVSNTNYATPILVGARSTGSYFPGDLAEVMLYNGVETGSWIATTYFSQSNPPAFALSGAPTSVGAATAIFGWYTTSGGLEDSWVLICLVGENVVGAWQQLYGVLASVAPMPALTQSMSFSPDGVRGYLAFSDDTGRNSTGQGLVINTQFSGADVLTPSALLFSSISTTVIGSGVITAGVHNIGVVYTTRNGFIGWSTQFANVQIIATGTNDAALVLTTNTVPFMAPDGTIQVAMTSTSNLSEYYLVPGAIGNFPSTAGPVEINWSITDGDLVLGTNVTLLQDQLVQNVSSGQGPFNPSAVFTYSSRMGYVTVDSAGFPVVYISDPSAYQSLNGGNNGVYLDGKQIPVQGCSIGGVLYIASLSGLFATTDNGGYPVTWTAPARVDGSVGIPAPSCIVASAGRILLASEKGLFSYAGGAFPRIPLSYWQAPDWNRINWGAPTQVQIVDDGFDRVIRVLAPLNVMVTNVTATNPIKITTGIQIGSQIIAYPHLYLTGMVVTISDVEGITEADQISVPITVTGANTFTIPVAGSGTYTGGGTVFPATANAEMSWNYSVGEDPNDILYSLNGWSGIQPGGIGIVRNLYTSVDEVWYVEYPGGSPLIRRVLPSDILIHRDVDSGGNPIAISSTYETGLAPGNDSASTMHYFHGAHLRVSGAGGGFSLTAYGLDHARSMIPLASPLVLANAPGAEILVKWFLSSEQQSISMSMNVLDAYFIAALLRVYWNPAMPIR